MDLAKDLIQNFSLGMANTTAVEYAAVSFGILSVYFSKQEKIAVFPTGIISTLLYIYLAWSGGLYAESAINFYYTIMSIYGWYHWLGRGRETSSKVLRITMLSLKGWAAMLMLGIIVWVGICFMLHTFTDSTVPVVDALSTATAFVAMYLMASKKLEHWWWWIATNVISIPLYYYKGYIFTCVQFTVFLILAIAGLISWSKKIKSQSIPSSS